MDGYASTMLHDDVSSHIEIDVHCPKCQLELHIKISDPFIKCMRCGEVFYIEEISEHDMNY